MNNIGTAQVRVTPNMTGIQQKIAAGFKGAAGGATAALGDEVDKNSSPFQAALGRLGGFAKGAGIAIAAGMATGVAGLAALTGKALMAGAELEQQLGGSEAVFGQYAASIQEKAKTAYTQAGLSQNEFLQGANKMGSLFQGAGFSVQQSMQMSADAMQRASDVASIMGIDTTTALEAVAGMAKGNFTMMDNLGVAMNDTAIQAYALSKGIDKSTASMTQQEKIGLAQQMFMEKTAKYAGNYAKENDTLAGSLNTTKKAFDNFMSTGDASGFVASLVNTIKIAVPQIIALLPQLMNGIVSIVQTLVPALSAALPTLLPALINAVVALIDSLVAAMPSIVQALLVALPVLIDGFIKLFLAIVKALPQIVTMISAALPTIINAIVNGLSNPSTIQQLLLAAVQLFIALVQAIPIIVNALVAALPVIIDNILKVLTNPVFIKAMIMAGVQLLKAVITGIVSMNGAVLGAVWDLIRAMGNALSPNTMWNYGKAMVEGLWKGISSLGGWLKDKIVSFVSSSIPGAIKNALGIHSPSRVAAGLGREVPRGLAVGIYKGMGVVERAATDMANSALTDMTAPALTPALAGTVGTTSPYAVPTSNSAVESAAGVVQNNNIYNQVDLNAVTRELAWQIRR